MSTAMTAQEIGEAWLAYVTDTFMLEDGCVRPEVEEEYKRLESEDAFTQHRELWRSYTDNLIETILQTPAESRRQLFSTTDHRSLAYVQDRVQCGTEMLTALVQKGLKINVEGTEALPDFFRQILLQNQV
ncbi:MAG: hypothetical protein HXX11_13335 [Desulfuromonadales bacterium]|nr:hypothetical protein [Desulfuromonadales bacterium]